MDNLYKIKWRTWKRKTTCGHLIHGRSAPLPGQPAEKLSWLTSNPPVIERFIPLLVQPVNLIKEKLNKKKMLKKNNNSILSHIMSFCHFETFMNNHCHFSVIRTLQYLNKWFCSAHVKIMCVVGIACLVLDIYESLLSLIDSWAFQSPKILSTSLWNQYIWLAYNAKICLFSQILQKHSWVPLNCSVLKNVYVCVAIWGSVSLKWYTTLQKCALYSSLDTSPFFFLFLNYEHTGMTGFLTGWN